MTDSPEEQARTRRRWVNLGEIIAIAALIVSALGLWRSWHSPDRPQAPVVVERQKPVALVLRGTADGDGKTLTIAPVEPSHALESLTLTIPGHPPIALGGDGRLAAGDLEQALKGDQSDRKRDQRLGVRITARYVERGADRRAAGNYTLAYRWQGGGLFGGRSIRLAGLTRS
ncbi:MAG: hypothetical protein ABIW16_05980 [Sphingomicrobium sp.]